MGACSRTAIRRHIGPTWVKQAAGRMVLKGTVQLDLVPQGRFRNAFAPAVPGFRRFLRHGRGTVWLTERDARV